MVASVHSVRHLSSCFTHTNSFKVLNNPLQQVMQSSLFHRRGYQITKRLRISLWPKVSRRFKVPCWELNLGYQLLALHECDVWGRGTQYLRILINPPASPGLCPLGLYRPRLQKGREARSDWPFLLLLCGL